jgi:hypothetical protein
MATRASTMRRTKRERGRNPARRLLPLTLLVAAVVVSADPARATPEFPGIVVQTLGLPGITIDPPNGCTLCHTTDSGGASLRPFGLLVQQDGAQPYEDATLEAALGEIAQSQPGLIADIKAGSDPNEDPSVNALPTPSYGCVQAAGASPITRNGLSLAVGAILALGVIRRRRRPRAR